MILDIEHVMLVDLGRNDLGRVCVSSTPKIRVIAIIHELEGCRAFYTLESMAITTLKVS
jgi:anthranilate/para-aminobenzoate synthase component I